MAKYTVAEARRLRDISQEKVAEHLGISLNTYRNKENGTSTFYIDEAYSLSELFQMDIHDISFASSGAKK